jgi:membrane protease YdiL (CAAX protease family)
MPPQLPSLLFLGAFFLGAVGVYRNLLLRVARGGGQVRTAEFALPDVLVSFVLISSLGMLILFAALHPAQPGAAPATRIENVLPGALFLPILSAFICALLVVRKVNLRLLFGFDRTHPLRAAVKGLGLVVMAVPLVLAAAKAAQVWLPDGGKEQDLVMLFREVARNSDHSGVLKIFVAGVILAPLGEEFLFRGYFYGVIKRYAGGVGSALFTSALFAAIHMNPASMPGLFVLALCLTLAYEASGSLIVPLVMHAGFNLSQLLYLYWDAQARAL